MGQGGIGTTTARWRAQAERRRSDKVMAESLITTDGLRRAVRKLARLEPRPRYEIDSAPRLIWHQDETGAGWIVEFPGFGVMHPYAYVDMFGEDDPLSKEIREKVRPWQKTKLGDEA
jgi:hypothetical protein